ncbi:cysteine dioxygenase type 1 [Lampris incognitus]|uniref:cysteine dioxygenase type 1 n=1 Tax=Lampris incognitus TaxID=2546036 RepID=UPI0024B51DD2|nr:cysteine dioxygenase type 1 [Lampris incognitus]
MEPNRGSAATLDGLVSQLHVIFESDSVNVEEVKAVMESYTSNPDEWRKYAIFDKGRYTRNLLDQGNEKFNLIILCWGEGHGSSIHDHSKAHCFMKMLQGSLKETRFDWPKDDLRKEMVQRDVQILNNNQVAYISDEIGLHRVENNSHVEGAVSLHLYSPPFQTCQTFDQRTGHRETVPMTFWSRNGKRTQSEAPAQENN